MQAGFTVITTTSARIAVRSGTDVTFRDIAAGPRKIRREPTGTWPISLVYVADLFFDNDL
jgi:hypothetical protein